MHSHGIHNDCEKILKKWMHFASGLKNNLQYLRTLCTNVIAHFLFPHESSISCSKVLFSIASGKLMLSIRVILYTIASIQLSDMLYGIRRSH